LVLVLVPTQHVKRERQRDRGRLVPSLDAAPAGCGAICLAVPEIYAGLTTSRISRRRRRRVRLVGRRARLLRAECDPPESPA
jgi:hypothetical protein